MSTYQENNNKRSLDNAGDAGHAQKRSNTKKSIVWDQVDGADTWKFDIKTNNSGGTAAYATGSDGKSVRVQFPRMTAPFGVRYSYLNKKTGEETVYDKPNLDLDVVDPGFLEWCNTNNTFFTKFISDNCESMLKMSDIDTKFVDKIYRKLAAQPNPEYKPKIRVKVVKEGRYASGVKVVTQEGSDTTPMKFHKGTLSDIEKNDEVVPIVEITGLWAVGTACGVSLSLIDTLVYKRGEGEDCTFAIAGVCGVEEDTSSSSAAAGDASTVPGIDMGSDGNPYDDE